MNGAHSQTDGVSFDSSNIGKREKPNFFGGRVRKSPAKDFIKFAFDGWHKFVSIGIVVVVITLAVVLVLWLTVWSRSDADVGGPVSQEAAWTAELGDIANEANRMMVSDSDTSFVDAVALLDKRIEEAEDDGQKFDIQMLRANILSDNGGPQMALDSLAEFDESGMGDKRKFKLFLAYRFAYLRLGDEASVAIYDEKIGELPKEITTSGGPADE